MNKLKMTAIILLIVSFGVNAESIFPIQYIKNGPFKIGKIEAISGTKLSFNDEFYKLSPTVKYSTKQKVKASSSVFKKGDFVAIKMIKINKKNYVDHIYKLYKK